MSNGLRNLDMDSHRPGLRIHPLDLNLFLEVNHKFGSHFALPNFKLGQ